MNPLERDRLVEEFRAMPNTSQADVAAYVLGEPVTIAPPDVADYCQDSIDEPFDARSFRAAQKLHQSLSRGRGQGMSR